MRQTTEWFFTEEGKIAYEKTSNDFTQRVKFIFSFLDSLSNANDYVQLFKLAYVMADTMTETSKEFSNWPNIFKKEFNPLISPVEKGELQTSILEYNNIVNHGISDSLYKLPVDYTTPAKIFRTEDEQFLLNNLLCALRGWTLHPVKFSELEQPGEDSFDKEIFMIEQELIYFFSQDGGSTLIDHDVHVNTLLLGNYDTFTKASHSMAYNNKKQREYDNNEGECNGIDYEENAQTKLDGYKVKSALLWIGGTILFSIITKINIFIAGLLAFLLWKFGVPFIKSKKQENK